jgi:hypothetical protein
MEIQTKVVGQFQMKRRKDSFPQRRKDAKGLRDALSLLLSLRLCARFFSDDGDISDFNLNHYQNYNAL